MKTFFGMTSKKVFMCFSAKTPFYGRHFMKSNKIGSHFARIFIKSKLLGVRLHLASYATGKHRIFDIAAHVCDCIYSGVAFRCL